MSSFIRDYLREFSKKVKTILLRYSGARGTLIHEKNWSRKSRVRLPLRADGNSCIERTSGYYSTILEGRSKDLLHIFKGGPKDWLIYLHIYIYIYIYIYHRTDWYLYPPEYNTVGHLADWHICKARSWGIWISARVCPVTDWNICNYEMNIVQEYSYVKKCARVGVQILRLTEIFSGVGPRPEVTFHIWDPKPRSGHSLKQKKIWEKFP